LSHGFLHRLLQSLFGLDERTPVNDRVGGPGDGEHADEEGDEKPLNVKIIKMNK